MKTRSTNRRRVAVIVALLCFCYVVVCTESKLTSIIRTKSGPVQGEILETIRKSREYASFKGIPFAESPEGELRFKPPVEKNRWTDVLLATREGDACMQYDGFNLSMIGSEDCLYLNVYTPHTNFKSINRSDLKAVMVWIYGGAFFWGYSNAELYGPDYLIEKDVVVVTFNYRLGPFGFLNVNHENATGNQGLKDQNMALKWVNKNIGLFGGDPKKVTLFGHSAGAMSVDYHTVSEMSRGLFHRSISMSSFTLAIMALASNVEAEAQGFALGLKMGIVTKSKDELLRQLLAKPADDLLKAARIFSISSIFRPTIERTEPFGNGERFLKNCVLKYYESGDYEKMPHMLGYTSNEFIAMPRLVIFIILNHQLQRYFNISITPETPFFEAIQYMNDILKLPGALFTRFFKITLDYLILGIDSKQRLMSKNNDHPIYYYRSAYSAGLFRRAGEIFNDYDVGHAEDLPFLFHMPTFTNFSLSDTNVTSMIDVYTSLWSDFAKHGNPTPAVDGARAAESNYASRIYWPDSRKSGQHLELKLQPEVKSRPINWRVSIYENLGLGTSTFINDCNNDS
ncbi:esterase B1-like [Trichogramma pretiosum]|uniref:esterase B1-like n=1 Tax=Trichogramma pretiosum TaxID=7493 RepID=UPI0006C96AEE|nr:esterase B1-like [Trichogramma pretiosum]